MVLLGKNVYNSEQEDADLLGTVTDVWLLRVTETGQPDTVTLYRRLRRQPATGQERGIG